MPTSRDRVAMGTAALCVPEGTKGDFHLRTSERLGSLLVNDCGDRHSKCFRQNSTHISHVLFPARASYSTWDYRLGHKGPGRAGNDLQS